MRDDIRGDKPSAVPNPSEAEKTPENGSESFPQCLLDIGITPEMIEACWQGYAKGLDIWGRDDLHNPNWSRD